MPPRSPTIVGSAVATIVWSSDASSSTSMSAPKIRRTRWGGCWGAVGPVEDDAGCMGASNADGAGSRASSADAVADALRERILRGDLAPGVHLSEVDLARELGVGRHTLRAALARLTRERLVVHYPNRGAFVATPTVAAGDDLFAYRTLLEQGGLALALQREADLGGLREALGGARRDAGGRAVGQRRPRALRHPRRDRRRRGQRAAVRGLRGARGPSSCSS